MYPDIFAGFELLIHRQRAIQYQAERCLMLLHKDIEASLKEVVVSRRLFRCLEWLLACQLREEELNLYRGYIQSDNVYFLVNYLAVLHCN